MMTAHVLPLMGYIDARSLADYLLKRRNPDGGFCHYSLDESNLNDTAYAILILDMLGRLPQDDRTVEYVRSIQRADGSYNSPYSAWCALKALKIMGSEPKYGLEEYVRQLLRKHTIPEEVYIERLSIFESSFYLAGILELIGRPGLCDDIAAAVLEYRMPGGSFGRSDPGIISTYHALSILRSAGMPMSEFGDSADFIAARAVVSGGFTKKPLAGLAFMDETYYALMTLEMLGKRPDHIRETIGFVVDCQNENGGFRRARASGISGFNTSYYAVESLRALIKS